MAPAIAFTALVAACFVMARRLAWEGYRRAAAWTCATAVVCFVLTVPVGAGLGVRLFVAVALGFGWITAYAMHLLRAGTPAGAGAG